MSEELSLLKRMFEHTLKLYFKAKNNERIFGNAFVEFGENELKIIRNKDGTFNIDKNPTETDKNE